MMLSSSSAQQESSPSLQQYGGAGMMHTAQMQEADGDGGARQSCSARRVIFSALHARSSVVKEMPARRIIKPQKAGPDAVTAPLRKSTVAGKSALQQRKGKHLPACINFPIAMEDEKNDLLHQRVSVLPRTGSSKAHLCADERSSTSSSLASQDTERHSNSTNENLSIIARPTDELPLFDEETPTISKKLTSILRSGRYSPSPLCCEQQGSEESEEDPVSKISSIESDIPSLASTVSSSESSSQLVEHKTFPEHLQQIRRAVSEPNNNKMIHFNSQVAIREFKRTKSEVGTTWFSREDLNEFRSAAAQQIFHYTQAQTSFLPTGAGRVVKIGPDKDSAGKVLFSHKALKLDVQPFSASTTPATITQGVEQAKSTTTAEDQIRTSLLRRSVAEQEIRNILVVDSHDIYLHLFDKGIKNMLPRVSITTAKTSEEALEYVRRSSAGKRGFDVVIVEERLKLFHRQQQQQDASGNARHTSMPGTASGSVLLCEISKARKLDTQATDCLYIGVSTHLQEDASKLKKNGADYVWSKPPPPMDDQLRDELARSLLKKRRNNEFASKLFD